MRHIILALLSCFLLAACAEIQTHDCNNNDCSLIVPSNTVIVSLDIEKECYGSREGIAVPEYLCFVNVNNDCQQGILASDSDASLCFE